MNIFRFANPFGTGRSRVATVPVFDAALKPNEILRQAEPVAHLQEPADLCVVDGVVHVTDGCRVLALGPGKPQCVLNADRRITALGAIGGGLAFALEGREVAVLGGRFDGTKLSGPESAPFRAVNSIAASGSQLILTDGSTTHGADDWRRDLMSLGATGRVFRCDLETERTDCLNSGMRFAFGASVAGEKIVVSESWRHRLVGIDMSGAASTVLDHLPAYPSRLSAARNGFWLTMFCSRSQLVEFVLTETNFRRDMINAIDPDLWIAPQLREGQSVHEPLQMAGLLTEGETRPWAPSRTYGLVVKLDRELRPVYSLHSRTGGPNHGIVAAAELGNQLYLLSMAESAVVRIDIAAAEREAGLL